MLEPTREQVRSLTTKAVRMTVDDFAINGFAIPKNIEESITDKYLFCYYLVKFAQEQERERINQIKEKHMNNTEIFSVAERMASHYVSGYCFNHADIAAFARWAAEQERERIIQFLQEMQRQAGDAHNHYGHAAVRIKEGV